LAASCADGPSASCTVPPNSPRAMAAGAASTPSLGQTRREQSLRARTDAQWLAQSLFCYSPDPTVRTIAFRRIAHIKVRRSLSHLPCPGRTRYVSPWGPDWDHHVEQAGSGSSLPVRRQLARLRSQSQRESAHRGRTFASPLARTRYPRGIELSRYWLGERAIFARRSQTRRARAFVRFRRGFRTLHRTLARPLFRR